MRLPQFPKLKTPHKLVLLSEAKRSEKDFVLQNSDSRWKKRQKLFQKLVLLNEAKRSEKDLVLPKRNSGAEAKFGC